MKYIMYTDGGARGNPGPAGIGGVVFDMEQNVVAEVSAYIGKDTNNQAEYQAIVATLEAARDAGATAVDCYMDSMLAVQQLSGKWKVKNPGIAKQVILVHNVATQIGRVTYTHVRREKNKHADRLVNEAIDKALGLA